jgi:hypothetical protein
MTFMMNDLEIAKQRLGERKLSLVFVKNSRVIFETSGEGLSGFIRAIQELDHQLLAASVADKTIGKAAALLCAYSRIEAAYAITMSKNGQETLKRHKIRYEYKNLVPRILNRKKTGGCPYEKLVQDICDPEHAYREMQQFCMH